MTAPSRQIGAALLALALAGCSCGEKIATSPPPDAAAPDALASLVTAQPPVTLTRDGKTAPAVAGPLLEGDALATGAGGHAVLRFKDGREVEIGENARFQITVGAGEIKLDIAEGVVISRKGAAADQGGVAISILTPFGLSRVPAAGEATVSVAGGDTFIEVHTGEITFVGKDGRAQVAHGGEKLEVALGEVRIVTGGAPSPAGQDAGAAPVQLQAMAISLSAERGAAQVKLASDAKFRTLAHGEEARLADGALFKVAPGGRGLIAADGLRMRLAGGFDGALKKATRDEKGAAHYELGAGRGAAQVFLVGAGEEVLQLPGPRGDVVIRSNGEASFSLTRDARSAWADVQAGRVEVTYQGTTRKIEAGELAALGNALSVSPHGRPALALATGRRIRVLANGLREVALTWPATDGARRVELSADAGFKELSAAGAPVGRELIAAAPAEGELHWRLLGEGDAVLAAGTASFGPEKVVPSVGGHPVNEVDETGLKATVYYQGALPALVFSFPTVEGAARYRVRLFKADDLKTALVDKTVDENRCAAEPGKVGEGSYLWNATPLSAAGAELAGGRMNKLDVVYDNAILNLTIDRPQPDELAAAGAAQVRTKGVAPLGSKLFINGLAAPVDARGRFELDVPRASVLVYRLVSPDSSESYWLRSLRAR